MKYFIKTFGCQQNHADSERVEAAFTGRGMTRAEDVDEANYVIVNTCMVRESAENRVYGLVHNLARIKEEKLAKGEYYKIIITGCMVGLAHRDKSGKFLKKIRNAMPAADEFLPIEEIGFDSEPVRQDKQNAWVPISNGCNNFCTFCIVPFTRGREVSRPYEDIIEECVHLRAKGYKTITLLGQNVNSYGADLLVGEGNVQVMRDLSSVYFEDTDDEFKKAWELAKTHKLIVEDGKKVTFVKHLGRKRIPTLFPALLADVARLGFEKVDFMSSNPWDFSDDLIDTIAKYPNITRTLHIALQSGSDSCLRRMNRWYTAAEFLNMMDKLRAKIPDIQFTTDIIVGFCGETDEEFEATYALCQKAQFAKAFISEYSNRPGTAASKVMEDDVPHPVKEARWQKLDGLINKPNLKKRVSKTSNLKP